MTKQDILQELFVLSAKRKVQKKQNEKSRNP